uniref:Uncharacterized protein n=1 Tax=Aegilops tauschii subsp. strangulata TaxID=200361 RepID=A0A453PXB1_AEGTS
LTHCLVRLLTRAPFFILFVSSFFFLFSLPQSLFPDFFRYCPFIFSFTHHRCIKYSFNCVSPLFPLYLLDLPSSQLSPPKTARCINGEPPVFSSSSSSSFSRPC